MNQAVHSTKRRAPAIATAQAAAITQLNVPAIQGLRDVYARGLVSGVFRNGIVDRVVHFVGK